MRTHGSKKTGQFVKAGRNVGAVPSTVQPCTLQDEDTYSYIRSANGQIYYPLSPLSLNTSPAADAVFLRRNGVTPIAADNGALTANIEFLTRAVLAAGIGAQRGIVELALGPDVTAVAAPGLGSANLSAPGAGGTGVSGLVHTDVNGLFRVTVSFNGAGDKLLLLKFMNEQYAISFAVA